MLEKIEVLKKTIRYRLSYSGTKETDILYKQMILSKINKLSINELNLLSNLFKDLSDTEIFEILTKNTKAPKKYYKLLKNIIND
tara:strand:+ start:111 stop:362 length:252 start_codon:yes stop_codon:yes gene_type:complete